MHALRIVSLVVGVVLLVVAAIWRPLVAPVLTKLPTSLNDSVVFTGTYTGYVNQSTGASLAAPQQLPLSIHRDVKAIASESNSADLVVNDASAISIGPAKSAAVSQYVLNRSTEQSVKSPFAYAVVPGDVVNRAGTYSLGPPRATDPARTYPFWTDEIGRAIPMTSTHTTGTVHGVAVQGWQINLPPTPMVTPMVKAMKLPLTMPFASFAAELQAKGVGLAAAFKALAPGLTAAQNASLAALTAAPIPLRYLYAVHSVDWVEPSTGGTVDVITYVQSYSVRPDLSALATGLAPILAAHPANPVVVALTADTKQLTSVPAQPLYSLTFHQTPASVASTADSIGHNASLLRIVSLWIPVTLGVIGLVLVGIAAVRVPRRRRAAQEIGTPVRVASERPAS
jgi:hypothetical protein